MPPGYATFAKIVSGGDHAHACVGIKRGCTGAGTKQVGAYGFVPVMHTL